MQHINSLRAIHDTTKGNIPQVQTGSILIQIDVSRMRNSYQRRSIVFACSSNPILTFEPHSLLQYISEKPCCWLWDGQWRTSRYKRSFLFWLGFHICSMLQSHESFNTNISLVNSNLMHPSLKVSLTIHWNTCNTIHNYFLSEILRLNFKNLNCDT